MPTLTGSIVTLRDFTEEDWPAVHDYASRPETVAFLPWGPNDVSTSKAWTKNAASEAFLSDEERLEFTLGVTLNSTGRVVGGCHLAWDSKQHSAATIGYCLNPTIWGQGVGRETGRLLIDFGFGKLGLHRIWATCDPTNTASKRILEGAGMTLEGIMRSHMYAQGRWRDSLLFAILEDEWRSNRS